MNIEINKKICQKNLRSLFRLNRLNSACFKVGRFLQRTRFLDDEMIDGLYFRFNGMNKTYKEGLINLKESLKNAKTKEEYGGIYAILEALFVRSNQELEAYSKALLTSLSPNALENKKSQKSRLIKK